MTEKNYITEDDDGKFFGLSYSKSIYNDTNIFMVSWWGKYSYFNNEQI